MKLFNMKTDKLKISKNQTYQEGNSILIKRGGYSLVWKVKDLKTDHNFAAK